MNTCQTISDMNNWMAYYNGIFQEKITSSDSIASIHKWLLSTEGNAKDSIDKTIDTIYFYITSDTGYLVEFSNGCINGYLSLNQDAVRELMFSVLGF